MSHVYCITAHNAEALAQRVQAVLDEHPTAPIEHVSYSTTPYGVDNDYVEYSVLLILRHA